MTDGLEGLTTQTPAMGPDSLQLHQYDRPPTIDRNQQGRHTVDDIQPLNDFVPSNLRLLDYDSYQDNVQHQPMNETMAGSSVSVPALAYFRRASDSPWSTYGSTLL